MISRAGNNGFFARHYDWIVAGVGVLALLGAIAYFVMSLGADAESAASEAVNRLKLRNRSEETGVVKPDFAPFASAARQARSPVLLSEVSDRQESFLASEKRVKCACGKVISGGLTVCPFCQKSLVVINKVDEAAKAAERWKKRFGVDPDDQDKDNDGFTNEEEYLAKTDPTDAKDHPDYLDSVQLQLPLKETFVPFYLKAVNKIPAGFRCVFAQGKESFSAMVGENLVITRSRGVGEGSKTETGFKLLSAEQKERKVEMAGVAGTKTVDASTVTIERASDGKKLELVVQTGKPHLTPVDVQATLLYTRLETKSLDVIAGSEIDLNGTKFKVVSLKAVGKGAEIVLENMTSGKKRLIKALE